MRKTTIAIPIALTLIAFAAARAEAEPARPKISGIAFVRINVTGADGGQGFYHGSLRMPLVTSGCLGPVSNCLFVNPTQQIDIVKVDEPSTGRQIASVGIFTSDAKALRQYLSEKGFKPGQLHEDSRFQTYFSITDPEDHNIVFVQQSGGIAGSIGGAPPIGGRLIHAGFVVKDRAKMDAFYKDILGFRPYWHGGMKDDETSWVSLQVPDGTDWIEYMLNIPENADKRLLGIMNHIALGVPDIHAAAKQLEASGMKLPEQPKIGRDGKWQLNLYDPDDTRVEFMEFTPVEKPCCSEYTGPHPKP